MRIVMPGNKKLGPEVLQTSLSAGPTCPGASEYCAAVCYAKKGFFRMPSVRDGLNDRTALAVEDLPAYEAQLRLDLTKLQPETVRIHAAGDFFGLEYIKAWGRVAKDFPRTRFYFYTRSWNTPLRKALERFGDLPNVTSWASSDPTMPAVPEGWREARIFPDAPSAREAGFTVCPEQTGKRASCSDCGLCYRVKSDSFRLAFIEH